MQWVNLSLERRFLKLLASVAEVTPTRLWDTVDAIQAENVLEQAIIPVKVGISKGLSPFSSSGNLCFPPSLNSTDISLY